MSKLFYKNDEINQMIRMRMAGTHPRDIATMFKRTEAAINRILSIEKANKGISYPKLPHLDSKWNHARIEDIARQTRFKKQKDIAIECGVSATMISQLMHMRAMMIRESCR